jgi:hypothetical protein
MFIAFDHGVIGPDSQNLMAILALKRAADVLFIGKILFTTCAVYRDHYPCLPPLTISKNSSW